MQFFTTDSSLNSVICLDVIPDLFSRENEGIFHFKIILTVAPLDFSKDSWVGLFAVTSRHGFFEEIFPFWYVLVSSGWGYVPLLQWVCYFTKPSLSSNKFRIDILISDKIHIIGPSVIHVMEILMMHSHVKQYQTRKMTSNCLTNDLSIIWNSIVRGCHCFNMLVVWVIDDLKLTMPSMLLD